MATETADITTMIGSLCTCASLLVWECVVAFFVDVVDFKTLFGAVGLKVRTKQCLEGPGYRNKVHLGLRE